MRQQVITRDQFEREIVKLLLRGGLSDLPKKPLAQYVLLKSVMLHLGPVAGMSEQEVNERLDAWRATVADGDAPDHATLRRGLIDGGFLMRSSDGASYGRDPAGPRLWQFEPAVDEVDVPALLAAAREEAERRRQAYLGR